MMMLPTEFVELLESHAEISIQDRIAHKRFTLVLRHRKESGFVWLPLSLEPGQRIVSCTGVVLNQAPDEVFLGLAADQNVLRFETVERLRLESGRFRVETFNAFQADASVPLHRRTAEVRVELSGGIHQVFSPTHPVTVEQLDGHASTLWLDVAGAASRGRFRFYIEPADSVPDVGDEDGAALAASLGFDVGWGSDEAREFVEPRRFRPRRRAGLRRLP